MDLNQIGHTIRLRRTSRKVRQEDLAEIAGISVRTLRDIENGVANPELKTLMMVCKVLGLRLQIEPVRL